MLEQNWGTVGGHLRESKTLLDIRNAFSQIHGTRCHRLDLFVCPETHRTTGNELRRLRNDVKELRTRIYQTTLARRYAQDWYEKARRDCVNEKDKSRKRELDSATFEWSRKCSRTELDLAKDQEYRELLTKELREKEAYFAQAEILDFIRSGRRKFSPFNVASAMAGMPYLSARVSSQRVWAMKPKFTKGHAYLVFTAIKANFSERSRNLERSIEQMREYLVAVRRNKLPQITELRKNWYFLERAIRSEAEKPRGSRGSAPYRIFAEYMNRIGCQRPGDSVLAETMRILIKGECPELEGLPHWNK